MIHRMRDRLRSIAQSVAMWYLVVIMSSKRAVLVLIVVFFVIAFGGHLALIRYLR